MLIVFSLFSSSNGKIRRMVQHFGRTDEDLFQVLHKVKKGLYIFCKQIVQRLDPFLIERLFCSSMTVLVLGSASAIPFMRSSSVWQPCREAVRKLFDTGFLLPDDGFQRPPQAQP
jgi:hypothetical protein